MMDRRTFLGAGAGLIMAPWVRPVGSAKFQFGLLKIGKHWNERARALVKLSFEIQKRCNIPIEGQYLEVELSQMARANSPFYILSGRGDLPKPTIEQARMLRLVLGAGGVLLIDDTSPKDDDRFYNSATAFMAAVFPEQPKPALVPQDHAVYQSYYLLKKPRGRLDREEYMEGWGSGKRTQVFYSHNDLLGAMEADPLGNWKYHMELGGGFRRELCFRLGINLTYYTLTLNYKKDRAFPPIIERRRRL